MNIDCEREACDPMERASFLNTSVETSRNMIKRLEVYIGDTNKIRKDLKDNLSVFLTTCYT